MSQKIMLCGLLLEELNINEIQPGKWYDSQKFIPPQGLTVVVHYVYHFNGKRKLKVAVWQWDDSTWRGEGPPMKYLSVTHWMLVTIPEWQWDGYTGTSPKRERKGQKHRVWYNPNLKKGLTNGTILDGKTDSDSVQLDGCNGGVGQAGSI